MVTSTKLLDLANVIKNSPSLSTDQVASSALFGSSSGVMETYSESSSYERGTKVPYLTDTGEVLILVAIKDVEPGQFNPRDWEEWNILDEVQGLYDDLIALSWNEPSLRRNKVWLEIKNESLQEARDLNLGNNSGLLIYKNFIVSKRKPTMTKDVIWGMITQETTI